MKEKEWSFYRLSTIFPSIFFINFIKLVGPAFVCHVYCLHFYCAICFVIKVTNHKRLRFIL